MLKNNKFQKILIIIYKIKIKKSISKYKLLKLKNNLNKIHKIRKYSKNLKKVNKNQFNKVIRQIMG